MRKEVASDPSAACYFFSKYERIFPASFRRSQIHKATGNNNQINIKRNTP